MKHLAVFYTPPVNKPLPKEVKFVMATTNEEAAAKSKELLIESEDVK